MSGRGFRYRALRAGSDFFRHGSLAGYVQMPLLTRIRLNSHALVRFIGTAEALRKLSYIIIWQLLAHILVWHFDLFRAGAALPPVLACLWICPWIADARRRHIHELLGGRWPR